MRQVLGFLLLLASVNSESAIASPSSNGYKCNNAGLQQEMNACAVQAFAAADKELNKVYKQLKASLNRSRQMELLEDERAWLNHLDTKCREAANEEAEGGSMWPMVFWQCKADATSERVETLRHWR